MNESEHGEPLTEIRIGDSSITLLGTAHVSKASADQVRELLQSGSYDAVAVELCPSRYNAIMDPDAMAQMDLFKVLKEGKASMVAATARDLVGSMAAGGTPEPAVAEHELDTPPLDSAR